MLASHCIEPVPTTVKNPTANSIAERLHLIMGDMLRCLIATDQEFEDPVRDIMAAAHGCHHIG